HGEAVTEHQAAIRLAHTQAGLDEELGTEYRHLGKTQEAEAAYIRELEIDPNNVLAKYKLGVLNVEKGDVAKGDVAKGKELIEAALKEKPGLLHSDYNLGRAEMLLGNAAAAAQLLERATSAPGSDPEVIKQAWYQLRLLYRRLQRMEEAQQPMATLQRLKAEEADNSLKTLRRSHGQQRPKSAQPS